MKRKFDSNVNVDLMDYSKILSQKYNGVDVWFGPSADDDVMIFVTDVLKLFPNKRINDFLSNKQTQELIEQISSETGIPVSQICYSTKGKYSDGRPQGTWMRRELALAFAMWLSSEFYLWCLNKLLELFRNGVTTMDDQQLNQILADNTQLQNIIAQLQQDNQNLQNQLNSWQPKANYYDQVLQNPEPLYSTKQVVKQLGIKMSYPKFLQLMVSNGFVYKDNSDGQYYVTGPYNSLRLRVSTTIKDKTGKYRSVNKWTEAGKQWIYGLAMGWNLI